MPKLYPSLLILMVGLCVQTSCRQPPSNQSIERVELIFSSTQSGVEFPEHAKHLASRYIRIGTAAVLNFPGGKVSGTADIYVKHSSPLAQADYADKEYHFKEDEVSILYYPTDTFFLHGLEILGPGVDVTVTEMPVFTPVEPDKEY